MNNMQIEVTAEDLEIEILHRNHEKIIANFETDTTELKEFLVENALRNQEWLISKTFLWFLKPRKELAAYITFMTDAIKIKGTYLQPFFNKKGITYPYIPALKIGRLCVDKRFEGNGIGTKMVIFAMKTSIGLNDMASCRFITVDAKRNERALNFYKKSD